jgi:hypothetical protein
MSDPQKDERVVSHYRRVILSLETLVQITNESAPDTKMAITINVKGLMISGFLAPLEEFYEHFTDITLSEIRQHNGEKVFEVTRDKMYKARSRFTEYREQVNKALVNSYVCIKGPKYHIPAGAVIGHVLDRQNRVSGWLCYRDARGRNGNKINLQYSSVSLTPDLFQLYMEHPGNL